MSMSHRPVILTKKAVLYSFHHCSIPNHPLDRSSKITFGEVKQEMEKLATPYNNIIVTDEVIYSAYDLNDIWRASPAIAKMYFPHNEYVRYVFPCGFMGRPDARAYTCEGGVYIKEQCVSGDVSVYFHKPTTCLETKIMEKYKAYETDLDLLKWYKEVKRIDEKSPPLNLPEKTEIVAENKKSQMCLDANTVLVLEAVSDTLQSDIDFYLSLPMGDPVPCMLKAISHLDLDLIIKAKKEGVKNIVAASSRVFCNLSYEVDRQEESKRREFLGKLEQIKKDYKEKTIVVFSSLFEVSKKAEEKDQKQTVSLHVQDEKCKKPFLEKLDIEMKRIQKSSYFFCNSKAKQKKLFALAVLKNAIERNVSFTLKDIMLEWKKEYYNDVCMQRRFSNIKLFRGCITFDLGFFIKRTPASSQQLVDEVLSFKL